jgi:hypothetical protein
VFTRLFRWLPAALLLFGSIKAMAHPLSPSALVLRERGAGRYEVSFRTSQLAAEQLVLSFPPACTRSSPAGSFLARAPEGTLRPASPTAGTGDQVEERFELRCPEGLAGQTVRVLGLAELSLSALVYVEFANGQSARGLMTAAQPSWVLPKETGAFAVFADYLALGVEHLLTGWDHLLFILGLMFLARGVKLLVWTLSAFTLGHSVTLCLAALSVVSVPSAPVEFGIAASLVALALALLAPISARAPEGALRPDSAREPSSEVASRMRRVETSRGLGILRLPGMAFGLGLLHGLGFASALAETGLPSHQIPVSLLGFNLGVECAQLSVVLTLSLLAIAYRFLERRVIARAPEGAFRRGHSLTRVESGRLQRGAAYLIGALSACWCIERALSWIG